MQALHQDLQSTRPAPKMPPRKAQTTEKPRQFPRLPLPGTCESLLDDAIDHMMSGDCREISRVLDGRTGLGEAAVDRAIVAVAARYRAGYRALSNALRNAGPMAHDDMSAVLAELEGLQ